MAGRAPASSQRTGVLLDAGPRVVDQAGMTVHVVPAISVQRLAHFPSSIGKPVPGMRRVGRPGVPAVAGLTP